MLCEEGLERLAAALQDDVAWRPDAILGRRVELAGNNPPFAKTCAATTIADLADRMRRYKGGKGTVQFPLDKNIPYDLIERIARYRIAEFDRSRSQ